MPITTVAGHTKELEARYCRGQAAIQSKPAPAVSFAKPRRRLIRDVRAFDSVVNEQPARTDRAGFAGLADLHLGDGLPAPSHLHIEWQPKSFDVLALSVTANDVHFTRYLLVQDGVGATT